MVDTDTDKYYKVTENYNIPIEPYDSEAWQTIVCRLKTQYNTNVPKLSSGTFFTLSNTMKRVN